MARPEELFRQSIVSALVTARDAWGRPTLGAQSAATPARFQPTRAFVRDSTGNSVQAGYVVYTLGSYTLQHRLWLVGIDDTADATKARRILAIDALVDGQGALRFYKVWL